jgi:DNA polymerase III alpha subunit
MSLLGGPSAQEPPPAALPETARWSDAETLAQEKETTGRYWSSSPLAEHEPLRRLFPGHSTRTVRGAPDKPFVMLGLLTGYEERVIKSGRNEGKRMARFRIEDEEGTIEAVMFSEGFERHRGQLADNRVLFFEGDVDTSREEVSVRVHGVHTPEEAPRALTERVRIEVTATTDLTRLASVLARHRGERPMLLSLSPEPSLRIDVRTGGRFSVAPSTALVEEVEALCGPGTVRFHRRPLTPPRSVESRKPYARAATVD